MLIKRFVGKSGMFFLLPLPSGMTSDNLELFGFWTYEFRAGHLQKWSTAQGRYGRPLRVSGIQHPSPHLICTASRNADGVYATAPYANTFYNGRRVYDYQAGDPQTRIWFMLYAQVLQADGASWRKRASRCPIRRSSAPIRNNRSIVIHEPGLRSNTHPSTIY